MTVTDYIRERLMRLAPDLDSNSYQARKISEWSDEFECLMRNRLIIGSLRYGGLKNNRRPDITQFHLDYIKQKLSIYDKTGNREMLVDVANLALVEFVTGDHPLSHFRALDRK